MIRCFSRVRQATAYFPDIEQTMHAPTNWTYYLRNPQRFLLSRVLVLQIFLWIFHASQCSSEDFAAGLAYTLDDALNRHQSTLSSMKSIHARLEYTNEFATEDGAITAGSISNHEIFKQGFNERYVIQTTRGWRKDAFQAIPPENQWKDTSAGELEIRSFSGWTPSTVSERLDPAKDLKAFSLAQCSIANRVPKEFISGEWRWLLIHVANSTTLKQLAEASRLRLIEAPEGMIRISVDETAVDILKHAIIDLDPAHVFLVCRVQAAGVEFLVDNFVNTDGYWFPESVSQTSTGFGAHIKISKVVINQPISQSELEVAFPPGARVDNAIDSYVCIWGDGKPEKIFSSGQEFETFVDNAVHSQAKGKPLIHKRPPGDSVFILIAFILGSLVLVALIFLRRRIAR